MVCVAALTRMFPSEARGCCGRTLDVGHHKWNGRRGDLHRLVQRMSRHTPGDLHRLSIKTPERPQAEETEDSGSGYFGTISRRIHTQKQDLSKPQARKMEEGLKKSDKLEAKQDDSTEKGACHQACRPEFNSQNLTSALSAMPRVCPDTYEQSR